MLGLLPAAVDPAVGLHVPVPRHAGLGAVARRRSIPVTHFLRVVRGALLKGQGFADMAPSLLALAIFVCARSPLLGAARWLTRTLDPAGGFMVALPRHAGLGAMAGDDHPGDAFPTGSCRGTLLKGQSFADMTPSLLALAVFICAVAAPALPYRTASD